ncbi:MAG: DUF6036 family nucleotidyltransferase [Anaerolineae bacterium]
MEPVTPRVLEDFFTQLGQRSVKPARLYLLGGSALCLLGSPRTTVDVDLDLELPLQDEAQFETLINELAQEMRLDVEKVPLAEFAPLAPDADKRHRFLASYGPIDVYIFDLYSMALSKIARGFDSDLEDVIFLLNQELIDFDTLRSAFVGVLPKARRADIDPREFQAYFDEIMRRFGALP